MQARCAWSSGASLLRCRKSDSALSACCVLATCCADVVPISLRLAKHRRFTPGPFRLGWMQVPCNLAAIAWIAVMTVRVPLSLKSLPKSRG